MVGELKALHISYMFTAKNSYSWMFFSTLTRFPPVPLLIMTSYLMTPFFFAFHSLGSRCSRLSLLRAAYTVSVILIVVYFFFIVFFFKKCNNMLCMCVFFFLRNQTCDRLYTGVSVMATRSTARTMWKIQRLRFKNCSFHICNEFQTTVLLSYHTSSILLVILTNFEADTTRRK